MSFRAKILLVILIIIALLIAIWIVLRSLTKPPQAVAPTAPGEVTEAPALELVAPRPTLNGVPVTTPEQLETFKNIETIKIVAKNFVERFGSYSVAVNFANFDDLKGSVTDNVWSWLQGQRLELAKKVDPNFIGVTTRALSIKVISSDAEKASVTVTTQREETTTGGQQVSYREMLVKLVLVNKQWLVDGAFWQ